MYKLDNDKTTHHNQREQLRLKRVFYTMSACIQIERPIIGTLANEWGISDQKLFRVNVITKFRLVGILKPCLLDLKTNFSEKYGISC